MCTLFARAEETDNNGDSHSEYSRVVPSSLQVSEALLVHGNVLI